MSLASTQLQTRLTYGLIVTLIVLGWITVILRLWVRLRITKNPGWDDATMVFTLCLFSCYCAFIVVIGRALNSPASEASLHRTLLYVQLGEIFYIITTTMLKISLGLFFLRLLTKRWQVLVFYWILGVSAVYGVIYAFVAIFQCGIPDNLLDNLFQGSDNCLPEAFLLFTGYLYGIVNVLADWTFVLIPIYILVESDMDRRSKISVGVVLALGAIGSISSIMRMVFLKGLLLNGGITPDAVKATFWATAEPGTGIIAASVAVLRPLFRKVRAEVRDKVTHYSFSKSTRSDATSKSNDPEFDAQSLVALTTTISAGKKDSPEDMSITLHSITSPTWDPNVTFEEARLGKVVNMRLTNGEYRPEPPPKP